MGCLLTIKIKLNKMEIDFLNLVAVSNGVHFGKSDDRKPSGKGQGDATVTPKS